MSNDYGNELSKKIKYRRKNKQMETINCGYSDSESPKLAQMTCSFEKRSIRDKSDGESPKLTRMTCSQLINSHLLIKENICIYIYIYINITSQLSLHLLGCLFSFYKKLR